MKNEHRLKFKLFRSTEYELVALNSIVEKMRVSKRSHEYIRRVMIQGFTLKDVVRKLGKTIPDVSNSISQDCSNVGFIEIKFRLNLEIDELTTDETPESRIWAEVSGISKRDIRKEYLRELFLYGHWFESLPLRSVDVIQNVFSNNAEVIELETLKQPLPKTGLAKEKLGALM